MLGFFSSSLEFPIIYIFMHIIKREKDTQFSSLCTENVVLFMRVVDHCVLRGRCSQVLKYH